MITEWTRWLRSRRTQDDDNLVKGQHEFTFRPQPTQVGLFCGHEDRPDQIGDILIRLVVDFHLDSIDKLPMIVLAGIEMVDHIDTDVHQDRFQARGNVLVL